MTDATRLFFGQARMRADRIYGHKHPAPHLSQIGTSTHGEDAYYVSVCRSCAHRIEVYEYASGQISGANPEYHCRG